MFNPKSESDPHFRFPPQCVWLKINGSWPLKSPARSIAWNRPQMLALLYEIWAWYVVISVGVTVFFQVSFLYATFGDILKTTENCCTTFMGLLNFVRLLHLRLNQRKFKHTIDQFVKHIWIDRNAHPDIERACESNMNTFRVMTILLLSLISLYCVLPLLELFQVGWSAEEKPFPYRMIFPYDAHRGWRYVVTYVFTAYAGVCVVTTLFAEDSLFGYFVTYTCGQFQVLHKRIDDLVPLAHQRVRQRLAAGSQAIPDRLYQLEYKRELDAVARAHNKLIEFSDCLEQLMSPILLVNFTISSILICMVGFQLVTGKDMFIGDYIKFLVFISSNLSQLYILCWNGDLLIQNSTDTAWHLYACNWQGIDGHWKPKRSQLLKVGGRNQDQLVPNTRYFGQSYCPADRDFQMRLKFMISRSQKPVKITALKFSTLSLQSFTKILSTSMSYFTLLQTVYDEGQK